MLLEDFKRRLKNCREYKIEYTLHSEIKLQTEQVPKDAVEENLREPEGLAIVQPEHKFKFRLYFKLSKALGHKYVIEIIDSEKIIKVITVVKLRIKWQKWIEKHARK